MNLFKYYIYGPYQNIQILMSLLWKVADKHGSEVRSLWNMAYLFFNEEPKDKLFEIPNCFGGWVSDMEIPAYKNHIRIMIENSYRSTYVGDLSKAPIIF